MHSACLAFSPPPIAQRLAIDNIPSIIPCEELDKAEFQPMEIAAVTATNIPGIPEEEPDAVHLIPTDSDVTKLLSPSDITTSNLAPYLNKTMTKISEGKVHP